MRMLDSLHFALHNDAYTRIYAEYIDCYIPLSTGYLWRMRVVCQLLRFIVTRHEHDKAGRTIEAYFHTPS